MDLTQSTAASRLRYLFPQPAIAGELATRPRTARHHENRIGDFHPLSFWCDDVFATAKIMKSKGVEFEKDPKKESWGNLGNFQRRRRQQVRFVEQVKAIVPWQTNTANGGSEFSL